MNGDVLALFEIIKFVVVGAVVTVENAKRFPSIGGDVVNRRLEGAASSTNGAAPVVHVPTDAAVSTAL